MKIGILGADGFLGKALCKQFPDAVKVTQGTYRDYVHEDMFDIFINANGNSRKYWAEKHPERDFYKSTASVMDTFMDFKIKHYIYISSTDAIAPKETYYGFHKYLAEQIVRKNSADYTILRCSALIGDGIKKGVVYDIINNKPLWITEESTFQFISVADVANSIDNMLSKNVQNETIDVGGWGVLKVHDIAKYLNMKFTERPDAVRYDCNYADTKRLIQVAQHKLKTSWGYVKEFAYERMDKPV